MRSNKMALHIAEVRDRMREHRDAMIAAFAEHLPEITIRAPEGGYFLWAELPEAADAETISDLAVEHGVEVSTGRLCFPEAGPGNFCALPTAMSPRT